MSEFRQHFLSDSIEKLVAIRTELADAPDRRVFRELVRLFHTIKGGGRMFSMPAASQFAAHAEETLHDQPSFPDCISLIDSMLAVLDGIELAAFVRPGAPEFARIGFANIPREIFFELENAERDKIIGGLARSEVLCGGILTFDRSSFAAEFAALRAGALALADVIAMVPLNADLTRRVFYLLLESDDEIETPFGAIAKISFSQSDADDLAELFEAAVSEIGNLASSLEKHIETRIFSNVFGLSPRLRAALATSLIHLVRNAVDHGIPDRGRIDIALFRERDTIFLSVADDGRGIDVEEIRRQAINLVPALAESQDIFELISVGGVSTATTVTDISGRGVGLEVVRAEIDALNGKISVENRKPKGVVFEIAIPSDDSEAAA